MAVITRLVDHPRPRPWCLSTFCPYGEAQDQVAAGTICVDGPQNPKTFTCPSLVKLKAAASNS